MIVNYNNAFVAVAILCNCCCYCCCYCFPVNFVVFFSILQSLEKMFFVKWSTGKWGECLAVLRWIFVWVSCSKLKFYNKLKFSCRWVEEMLVGYIKLRWLLFTLYFILKRGLWFLMDILRFSLQLKLLISWEKIEKNDLENRKIKKTNTFIV